MTSSEISALKSSKSSREEVYERRAMQLSKLLPEDLPDSVVKEWPKREHPLFPPARSRQIYI